MNTLKPTIYWIDGRWSGKLAILARPRGNDWLEDEINALSESGVDVLVSLLTNEENQELGLHEEAQIARSRGLMFMSFPVEDYDVPISLEGTFELINYLDDLLSRGKKVGVHCRQSIGRSSLIAACLLSLSGEDVDHCFKIISQARGTNVPDTPQQRDWVRTFARTFVAEYIN